MAEQLAMLLSAGYSLGAALNRLAARGSGNVSRDLARVCSRIRQGLTEIDALREWAEVADVEGLNRLLPILGLNREASDLGRLISEEARSIRKDTQRRLIETAERRAQQVWIPVTVAALVPGVIFLAVALATRSWYSRVLSADEVTRQLADDYLLWMIPGMALQFLLIAVGFLGKEFVKLAVQQMPIIPLMSYNVFTMMDETYWTGYPNFDDPYTNPVPNWANSRYMLVRLKPTAPTTNPVIVHPNALGERRSWATATRRVAYRPWSSGHSSPCWVCSVGYSSRAPRRDITDGHSRRCAERESSRGGGRSLRAPNLDRPRQHQDGHVGLPWV